MLATSTPNLRLFWTAYDPLDLVSGSIDVLGLQSCYIALANKLLPGFTTVTTSPRYVSMLCAAVAAAEAAFPGTRESAVGIRQARLAMIKSYERAWALACGLAATDGGLGNKAVDGLRGIQYVRRRLSELSGREKYIRTSSFNLLANQVRYGGIGAYSTMLEDCHLASMRSISIRSQGSQLADAFPRPDGSMMVWDEDKPLSIDDLREWGSQCHLGLLSRQEGRSIITALRGGEEGGWDDDVRWTSLRLLAAGWDGNLKESVQLDVLAGGLHRGDYANVKAPVGCLRQIEATLSLIRPYETFSQAIQFLFDSIRAAATDEPVTRLQTVASSSACTAACQGARTTAASLLQAINEAELVHAPTAYELRKEFADAGVIALAGTIRETHDDVSLLNQVLDRHFGIQHDKHHRGERKTAWLRRDGTDGRVRLSAQRHQLAKADRYGSWEQVPWHPYRTFGAARFIRACGIR